MKQVVLQEPYKIAIEEAKIPEPNIGEVLLKVLYGGICGGDLSMYRGNFFLKRYPTIPGHEFSAQIESVDPDNAYGLKKGMVVTGLPYYGCGECFACKRGFPQACLKTKTLGMLQDGAFRNYFVLPEWKVFDCTGLDPVQAALVEPLVIGYHAASRPGLKSGNKVLIIGAGTIGIMTALMAKELGAEVTISDIEKSKLEFAQKECGIPHTILNDDPDRFVEKINDYTHGDGFEIVMEAAGVASAFLNSIEIVSIGGKVVSIGVGKNNIDFDYNAIQRKHITIYGSRNGLAEDFKNVIEIVRSGSLGNIRGLVTKITPFTEAAIAYDNFDKSSGNILKSMLSFVE